MKRLSAVSMASLLLAAAAISSGAADAPVSIVVMFESDVDRDELGAVSAAELGRLQADTGLDFEWVGNTRTNARIFRTPAALTRDEATALARRIGVMEGVLWAAVEAGQGTVYARSALPAVAGIEEFIIRFKRGAGSLPLDAAKLSAVAGAGLVPTPETVGAAQVYRLLRPVSLTEAGEIERRLEALPEVRYADPVTRMKAQATAEPVTPSDEYFPQQWHLQSGPGAVAGSANVQAAWSLIRGGARNHGCRAGQRRPVRPDPSRPRKPAGIPECGENRDRRLGHDPESEIRAGRQCPRQKAEGRGRLGDGGLVRERGWKTRAFGVQACRMARQPRRRHHRRRHRQRYRRARIEPVRVLGPRAQ
ncbi:exported protein of unknown function [Methylococcus capsulatus]|jgi:hypothetical protein|uniref:Uncharacterized protein n=1 Tax=Methylococcus capsulatus TaxID=414 RepID=A0AA35XYI7_METCP|nr:hypothetical protein [Methylococcus capsulatus]CAI8815637.1 exported protein of unknown function [Methylococcus capsulatus]